MHAEISIPAGTIVGREVANGRLKPTTVREEVQTTAFRTEDGSWSYRCFGTQYYAAASTVEVLGPACSLHADGSCPGGCDDELRYIEHCKSEELAHVGEFDRNDPISRYYGF